MLTLCSTVRLGSIFSRNRKFPRATGASLAARLPRAGSSKLFQIACEPLLSRPFPLRENIVVLSNDRKLNFLPVCRPSPFHCEQCECEFWHWQC